MRLVPPDAPGSGQDPAPKYTFNKARAVRRVLLALVLFGGGVLAWLHSSYRGQQLVASALELTGQWPEALWSPDELRAHRLVGWDPASGAKKPPGPEVIPGWHSVEVRHIEPGSAEARRLAALFDEGKLTQDHKPLLYACDFQADFALEWVKGNGRRAAVFDLACERTDGNAGIHWFSAREVAQYAAALFPEDPVFRLAAAGEKPR